MIPAILVIILAAVAVLVMRRRRTPRRKSRTRPAPPAARLDDELRMVELAPPRAGPALWVTADGSALALLGSRPWPAERAAIQEVTRLDPYDRSTGASVKDTPAGSLVYAHSQPATVTPLADGSLLILDGEQAERYHPGTASSRAVAHPIEPRNSHTATALSDGRVLVLGGLRWRAVGDEEVLAERAEIGDGERFGELGPMVEPRFRHAATLLADGRVLVTGGVGRGDRVLAAVEIFDPTTGLLTAAAAMRHARTAHTSTRLKDGRVLVAGGHGGEDAIASVEIFNPADGSWQEAPPLSLPREEHAALLLQDGTVLVVGAEARGQKPYGEIFDPGAGHWRAVFPAEESPRGAACALLPCGRAMIAFGRELHLFSPHGWQVERLIEWTRARSTTTA